VGIRLLLAEDHQILRRRLRTLLQEHQGCEVVAEASDGREAVRLAEAHRPDIAVIGLAIPVLNGIEATRRIVERSPVTRVIILSTHAGDVYVEQTRRAGAVGFVLIDAAGVDLPAAIDEIAKGGVFTSPMSTRADTPDWI
jgi:DNA-binding NarL/FixJ family response regulator